MLELLYIGLFCFTVLLFFVGLGNIFKFEKEVRLLFMFITSVLFIVLTYASFVVESKYCVYTTEFICETVQSQEYVMAAVAFLLLIITLMYMIFEWLGKIPQPTVSLADVN